MRATSLDVLPVLHRQGETHPRQHLVGTAVCRTFTVRLHLGPQLSSFEPVTRPLRKPKAVVRHAVQVVTTRCPAVLVTEVVHARVHTSHCQTRQRVTADWKVSCPIQESAGASTAEEGQARQFTASELQADLQPADRVQGPGETHVGTIRTVTGLSSATVKDLQ